MNERPSATDLEASLAAEVNHAAGPGAQAVWLDGPDGLRAVVARVRGAPMGTGYNAAVVTPDDQLWAHWRVTTSPARYGGAALPHLAAHLGWFQHTPTPQVAAFALDFALWDGLNGVGRRGWEALEVAGERSAVTVRLPTVDPRSEQAQLLVVHIPQQGPVAIRREAAEPQAVVLPIDAATRLERALASDESGAIQSAVSAMHAPFGPRELRALALTAVTVPGMTGGDAVMRLHGDAQGLGALRDALAAQGGALTGPAREIADALWGPGALE